MSCAAVVECLASDIIDAKAARWGFQALQRLLLDCPPAGSEARLCQQRLFAAGAGQTVMAVMKKYPDQAGTQKYGAGAIALLAQHPPSQAVLAEHGACEAVMAALPPPPAAELGTRARVRVRW
eukprot:TRINITY_DN18982_c0_g1_i1.p1 TRINITY_DN18982_c0_g1~~TRINITY_DN18982_c0_g1_i1.p1  ORF type:complete len:123 (+),score=15.40 TRINITY_DN18982_c0_g1_i1:47-415(+)